MNILFVHHDTCLYGASQSLLALVEGLRSRGHTCTVLLPQAGPLVQELEARDVAHDVIAWQSWTSCERQWFPRRLASGLRRLHRNRRIVDAAARQCAKRQPDLIHTNSSKTPFGALLARRMGLPHTWHFREFLGGPYSVGQVFSLGRRISCELIRAWSSALVVISHSLRRQFDSVAGRIPIHVVYNGVMSQSDVRQCCHTPWPDGDTLILALVGRFEAWKHPLVALEAMRILKDQHEKVRLLVAGSGEEAEVQEVRGFVNRHALHDTVELLGFVKGVKTVFVRCHALLMCSTGDAFGRVTAEAMAYGRPVIGADAGATSELVQDGADGLLFRAGDSVDLAGKIRLLAHDRHLLAGLGENAVRKAHQEFTVEKYAESMERIFLSFTGGC